MITNLTKGTVLADREEIADSFFRRLKGLLGRKGLGRGEALVIDPCSGVHTIGMRFSIDVLFLDREGQVIGLGKVIPPNRLTRVFRKARLAVELPVCSIERSGTDIGDRIRIDGLST